MEEKRRTSHLYMFIHLQLQNTPHLYMFNHLKLQNTTHSYIYIHSQLCITGYQVSAVLKLSIP